jgi:arylsulfatase A-like enzyme
MKRREFLRLSALGAASAAVPSASATAQASSAAAPAQTLVNTAGERPNIIFIVADQRTYGLSKANGYPLDTSPTLDRFQAEGIGFERNYCTIPLCVPSRISMLTGRWPDAHRVRMNLQPKAAVFEKDLYQVAKSRGYRTALVGKNHTYLTKADVDVWSEYSHEGGPHGPDKPAVYAQFDKYLHDLHYNIAESPAPFGLQAQLPYRIVSDAIEFIDNSGDQPFCMQVGIPEPHDPEQVPEPYWNMFPPESIPARCGGPDLLPKLGFRMQWEYRMQQDASPQTEPLWRRYLSNYMGALRMIDDQIKRLTEHLDAKGLTRRTLIVFTSDHGDSLMNFGIGHKGLDLREPVTHTPQIWWGYGVKHNPALAHVFTSMADLMPTMCEAIGADIPHGVQGRSLWPLLRGEEFPADEFRSIYTSLGVGGLYYEESDHVPPSVAQNPNGASFDELNMVTLSGNSKMVRMGDWKLVYDMMGYGQLYNLLKDPCELTNVFGKPDAAKEQAEMMAELAMWVIRTQDSLPTGPQNNKYQTKWPAQHNWYAPYRHGGSAPNPYIP